MFLHARQQPWAAIAQPVKKWKLGREAEDSADDAHGNSLRMSKRTAAEPNRGSGRYVPVVGTEGSHGESGYVVAVTSYPA